MGAETERRPDVGRVYVSLFATGLLGIGYEILVLRAFSQILENTVYSFAAILSVYLFGTALGRAVYQVRPPKPGFRTALGRLAKGLCLACMTGLFLLFFVEKIYSAVRGWIGPGAAGALTAELSAAAAVFLPPTVVMGMTFSHLAQSACRKKGGLGRALSVNTVGAAVSVVADPGGHVHLKVNNHYQMGGTSSAYSDRRQAHIPLLLHPAPQRALFLGLGTGPHALRRSRGA
jgi:spermidine synthase